MEQPLSATAHDDRHRVLEARCPSQWLHSERKLDDVPASLADGDINLAPLRRGFFLERSKFRRSRLASAPSFRQR
jgi:hypothetical protein